MLVGLWLGYRWAERLHRDDPPPGLLETRAILSPSLKRWVTFIVLASLLPTANSLLLDYFSASDRGHAIDLAKTLTSVCAWSATLIYACTALCLRFWNHCDIHWFVPWFLIKRHTQPFRTFLGALLYTVVLLWISYVVVLVSLPHVNSRAAPYDFLNSPGIFYAFCALLAAVWSVLNTAVILVRQHASFAGFGAFSFHLAEFVGNIASRSPEPGQMRETIETVYMVDYSPTIGDISKPDLVEFNWRTLYRLQSLPHCVAHLVFATDEALSSFYRRFDVFTEEVNVASPSADRLIRARTIIDELDRGSIAVWRSDKISEEHYLASGDFAVEYTVVSKLGGRNNELRGEATHDSLRIEYVSTTAEHYVRSAITPTQRGLKLLFPIRQSNIAGLTIGFAKDPSDLSSFSAELPAKDSEKLKIRTVKPLLEDEDEMLCDLSEFESLVNEGFCFCCIELIKERPILESSTRNNHPVKSPPSLILKIEV